MALSETAALLITLSLKDNATRAITGLETRLKGLDRATARTQKSLAKTRDNIGKGLKAGAVIGSGALALLVHELGQGIQSMTEQQNVSAQTAAALKSTGESAKLAGVGVKTLRGGMFTLAKAQENYAATVADAGVNSSEARQAMELLNRVTDAQGKSAFLTQKHIEDLAQSLEDKTTIDNKEIQAAENLLLTFTKVRNEAGKGNDIFDQSTAVLTDLATAMHTDVSSGAIKLGKALNDPLKGITALTKIGVTFSEQQKKQIAHFVKTGQVAKAQKVILAELTKEFGGSAAAAADTYAGKQRRMKDAIEGVQVALATALLPALTNVSTKLSGFLKQPGTIKRVEHLGQVIADFFSPTNIDAGGGVLKKAFDAIGTIDFKSIGDGLRIAGDASKRAFDIFQSLDPDMKKIIIGALAVNKLTGGLVSSVIKDVAGIALKSLTSIFAGNVTVIGKNVVGGGGGAGVPGGGTGGGKGPGVGTSLVTIAATAGVGLTAERYLPVIGEELTALQQVKDGQLTGLGLLQAQAKSLEAVPELQLGIDAVVSGIAPLFGIDASAAKMAERGQTLLDVVQPALIGIQQVIADQGLATTQATIDAGSRTSLGLGSLLDKATTGNVTQAQTRADLATNSAALQTATTNGLNFLGNLVSGGLGLVQGAVNAVTGAVNRKDLSVNVNVNASVSVRDIQNSLALSARYGTKVVL